MTAILWLVLSLFGLQPHAHAQAWPEPLPSVKMLVRGFQIPVLATNTGTTVVQAGLDTIKTTELRTTDGDTPAASLAYTVTVAATRCTLKVSGTPGSTFTQANIDANAVTLTHDASAAWTDSLTFSVTDGHTTLSGNKLAITITPQFYGLTFDGGDQAWAAHSTSLNITTAITVEGWAISAGTPVSIISAKWLVTGSQRSWTLRDGETGYEGKLCVQVSADGGSTNLKRYVTTAAVFDGVTWKHVAFTFTANSLILYVNGVAQAVTKLVDGTVNTLFQNTEPVTMGATANAFVGRAAGLRIWNVVRTQAQIQAAMYTPFLGPTTGLVLEYPMSEGTGQTITDWSGNSNTGTLGATTDASTDDPAWTTPAYDDIDATGPHTD